MAITNPTTSVIQNTVSVDGKYIVRLTYLYNAADETNVVKIDKSTFTSYDGSEPNIITIKSVRWNIQGFTYVKLSWDHADDDTAYFLSSNGYDNTLDGGGTRDPASTGGTGDLLLTTAGGATNATYDITLECEMK